MGVPRHSQRGSTGRIVAVLLAALVVGSAAVAGVAVFSTGGAASSTAASSSNPIKFVYVDSDSSYVTFVTENGTRVSTNQSADIVGPMADLDGDGDLEAPFVTDQNEIYAVDKHNETQFIANSTYDATTKIGVGDWTGDGTPEVVYANTSDQSDLYYSNVSGSPTKIAPISANAVLGADDFDGVAGPEIVYIGTSGTLKYYNSSGVTKTGYSNFGSNNKGLGAGAPYDFNGTGELWIPAMDGSSVPEIVNASGFDNQPGGNSMGKAPAAGVNWAGDSNLEILHLNGNDDVSYTYLSNGTTETLYDADNNKVSAKHSAGVAGVVSRPADTTLSITEFEVTGTGYQNVSVNVTANQELSALNVTLSGPENATLRLSDGDFFTGDNSAPYTYSGTYNASTDGNYTAELERAAATDDDAVNDSRSDNATVDDVSPNFVVASLVDDTDGDEYVTVGDTVTVSALVEGDVDTVTANLSVFGAGTVTLTHDTGDAYNTDVQVSSDAVEGNHTVDVVATDGQGNQERLEAKPSLEVDTTNLTASLGSDKTAVEGEEVSFSASVSNASGEVTYDWSFGDGASASGESVTHTYQTSGTYTVTVNVTDGSGEIADSTTTVDIEDPDSEPTTEEDDGPTGSVPDTSSTETTVTTTTPTTTQTTTTTATITTTDNPGTTATTTDNPGTTETTSDGTTTEEANTPTTEDDEGGGAIGEAPGFGLGLALLAMVGAALLARRE